MGYAHYWRKTKDASPETWAKFTRFIESAINRVDGKSTTSAGNFYSQPVKIGDGMGEGDKPTITADEVSFNGIDELAHETFFIKRTEKDGFNFCKTARKPYDVLVVACLVKAKGLGIIDEWSSDGDMSDHEEGMMLKLEVDKDN